MNGAAKRTLQIRFRATAVYSNFKQRRYNSELMVGKPKIVTSISTIRKYWNFWKTKHFTLKGRPDVNHCGRLHHITSSYRFVWQEWICLHVDFQLGTSITFLRLRISKATIYQTPAFAWTNTHFYNVTSPFTKSWDLDHGYCTLCRMRMELWKASSSAGTLPSA